MYAIYFVKYRILYFLYEIMGIWNIYQVSY